MGGLESRMAHIMGAGMSDCATDRSVALRNLARGIAIGGLVVLFAANAAAVCIDDVAALMDTDFRCEDCVFLEEQSPGFFAATRHHATYGTSPNTGAPDSRLQNAAKAAALEDALTQRLLDTLMSGQDLQFSSLAPSLAPVEVARHVAWPAPDMERLKRAPRRAHVKFRRPAGLREPSETASYDCRLRTPEPMPFARCLSGRLAHRVEETKAPSRRDSFATRRHRGVRR